MNNKIIALLSICLVTVLSQTKVYALTSIELGELIECKASYQDFIGLGLEYKENLKSLGWMKDTLDNLDIYRNQKMSLNVFGRETHEIALFGPAIFAVYRNIDVKELAQEFDIPKIEKFAELSVFRGAKNIYRRDKNGDNFGYSINLNLSEMVGENTLVLLGCSYEVDQNDIDSFFEGRTD